MSDYEMNVVSHLGSVAVTQDFVTGNNCAMVSVEEIKDYVYNKVQVVGTGTGTAQIKSDIKEDIPSQTEFGIKDYTFSDVGIADKDSANELADTLLAKHKDSFRVIKLTVRGYFLRSTLGDNVTVTDEGSGLGYTYVISHGSVTGTFVVGETVTGGTSGATGIFDDDDSGVMTLDSVSGTFVSGEVLTGGSSSAYCTSSSDPTVDGNTFRIVKFRNVFGSSGNAYELELSEAGVSLTTLLARFNERSDDSQFYDIGSLSAEPHNIVGKSNSSSPLRLTFKTHPDIDVVGDIQKVEMVVTRTAILFDTPSTSVSAGGSSSVEETTGSGSISGVGTSYSSAGSVTFNSTITSGAFLNIDISPTSSLAPPGYPEIFSLYVTDGTNTVPSSTNPLRRHTTGSSGGYYPASFFSVQWPYDTASKTLTAYLKFSSASSHNLGVTIDAYSIARHNHQITQGINTVSESTLSHSYKVNGGSAVSIGNLTQFQTSSTIDITSAITSLGTNYVDIYPTSDKSQLSVSIIITARLNTIQ